MNSLLVLSIILSVLFVAYFVTIGYVLKSPCRFIGINNKFTKKNDENWMALNVLFGKIGAKHARNIIAIQIPTTFIFLGKPKGAAIYLIVLTLLWALSCFLAYRKATFILNKD